MKSIIIIFMGIVICLSFTSCSNEKLIYSCDPEINEFVKSNLSEIQALTRSEFIQVKESLQLPFFKALSSEKKQSIWLGKLDELLKLDWTPLERSHIELAYNKIHDNLGWYSDPSKYEDEIDIFCYKWQEYAQDELGWDNTTIYYTIINPNPIAKSESNKCRFIRNDVSGMNGIPGVKLMGESPEEPPTKNCTCSTKSNNCGTTGIMKCKKWNCIATRGCGSFGVEVCDGGCFRTDL